MGIDLLKDRLQVLRKENKLTQKEMAEQLNIKAATLSAYESGKSNPSAAVLVDIAEKYSVSLDWLCGLSDKKTVKSEDLSINNYGVIIKFLKKISESIEIWLSIGNPPYAEPQREDFKKFIDTSDKNILDFFDDWDKILDLYISKTIDEELYDLWFDNQIKKYEKIKIDDSNRKHIISEIRCRFEDTDKDE